MAEPRSCPRHPDVDTRLSCSACEEPICADCAQEAAVGYQCPSCAGQEEPAGGTAHRQPGARWLVVRAALVGGVAAVAAGLLLGPVLAQGTFFLLSSGALGWLVARAVYWAADEASLAPLRAVAMTAAGLMVVVGLASGADPVEGTSSLAVLALPAALYGGWICVRAR